MQTKDDPLLDNNYTFSKGRLSHNTHTFLRAPGHIILSKGLPGSRESRLLGRFQLHHQAYNRERESALLQKNRSDNINETQELVRSKCKGWVQSSTYISIKATIEDAAVVVWAAPE